MGRESDYDGEWMVVDNYTTALDCLLGLCRAINLLPLERMLGELEQMEALGPILQPTAYRDGGGTNLAGQRRVITAARQLQVACEQVAGRRVMVPAELLESAGPDPYAQARDRLRDQLRGVKMPESDR